MSTLAVFLLLAGGTALAANQLAKKSVGAKQLKSNAVTTAKIKKNAVTAAKIKAGAVDGTKIADAAISGAEINAASTPFSQAVTRLRNAGPITVAEDSSIPLGTFTQNAGEDNQYVSSLTVNLPASCEPPRAVIGVLLIDPPTSGKLAIDDAAGVGILEDSVGGTVSRTLNLGSFLSAGRMMTEIGPAVTTSHTPSIVLPTVTCSSGGGVSVSNAGLDVIGTK